MSLLQAVKERFGDRLDFLGHHPSCEKKWTHQPSASIMETACHLEQLFHDGNFEEKIL